MPSTSLFNVTPSNFPHSHDVSTVAASGASSNPPDDFGNDEAHATAIPAGGSITGRFDYSDDADVFRVRLAAGVTYQFDLAPGAVIGSIFSLNVGLTDAAHNVLTWGNANYDTGHAVAAFAPAVTGDYFVNALYTGTNLGSYQLSVKETPDDFGASPANSGKLAIGASVQGTLEVQGDRDWFAVNLQAGIRYTFQLDQGNAGGQNILYLLDASGANLGINAAQYSSGGVLTWTPATSGTYLLDVGNSAWGNVHYTLQARAGETDDHGASADTAGVIVLGQSTSGRLEMPGDADWFKISMKANTAYTFQLHAVQEGTSGAGQGGELSVVDGSGRVLASGPYNGASTQLTWQASADGDCYVAVSASYEIFSYTIDTSTNDQDRYPGNAATTGVLSPGGIIQSSVDFNGDTDWFKVDLQAGQQYTFQMTGSKQAGGTLEVPELVLYNSDKFRLWTADGGIVTDPTMTFTPTTSGTYYLQAGANSQGRWDGGGTGTYTLKLGSTAVPITDTPPKAVAVLGPELAGTSPQTDNIYITFNEAVELGTGAVTLRLATGQLVEKFDVATSARVSFGFGFSLIIDPTAPLAYGTSYRVDIDATAFKDKAGLPLTAPFSATFATVAQPLNVVGGSGNDFWLNTNNSDVIDGGAGLDTVTYKANSSTYVIHADGQTVQVEATERDTLQNVERIVFNDLAIAFDLGGTAGDAYRLYQASFDRAPDAGGLGFWIAQMDNGMTLHEVAKNFIASAEFKMLFGVAPSDEKFLQALYGNVLHRQADADGFDFWTKALSGGADRTDVLVAFSTSDENQAAVIGQISHGISYLPYH